jgi:hypothetical protein
MTLSVFIVTRDSAVHIERLLRSIRGLCDELVIGVDSRSVDATEDVCRPYADQVFRLEAFGDTIAVTRAWLIEQCHGDWVFNLDDDELLSTRLVRALPAMMQDSATTHYWFRKRWLAWPDGTRWLSGPNWAPDWQPRLFRPGPLGVHTRGEAHSPCEVSGDGRLSLEGCIYHLDHLLRTPQQRLAKAQRYERIAPGNEHWDAYVIPDGSAPPTEPVPADDLPWEVDTHVPRRQHPPLRAVSIDDMHQALVRSRKPDSPPPLPLPTIPPAAELFRAELVCLDDIRTLAAGQPVWLTLRVSNLGPVPWGRPGTHYPEVRVTCNWLRSDGQMLWFDAGRSELSCVVQPGHSEIVQVGVLPPNELGRYRLEWELVMEHVGWFSRHGWAKHAQDVYVYRAALPLSDRRAGTFARFFGVDEVALDGAAAAASGIARLMQMEADRRAREETIDALTARLAESDASESGTGRLMEMETDRREREEAIAALTAQLAESEADRAARLVVIEGLSAHRAILEEACAARLELAERLTAHIAVLEARRATSSGIVARLTARLMVFKAAWRTIKRRFAH